MGLQPNPSCELGGKVGTFPDHLLGRQKSYNGPLCQAPRGVRASFAEVSLHRLDWHFHRSHWDGATDHIDSAPDEGLAIIWISTELGRPQVLFAPSAIGERMTGYGIEEAPHVEVIDPSIRVQEMTGSALTQTKQAHSTVIRGRVWLRLEQTCKIRHGKLC